MAFGRAARLTAVANGLVATAVLAACALLRDERGAACGHMDQPIAAQVAMAHARDYQQHFPRMGRAPELEIDAPAFAVAFAGALSMGTTGGPAPNGAGGAPARPQPPLTGVVCFVVNGSPTYYVNVDISGWH
jgi:hypothetical protein